MTTDEQQQYLDDINLLSKYMNEVEECIMKDQFGKTIAKYVFTDRAILARHKILLKETIGRGSYSKVKQAYDLVNFRQVAVKIIDCSKAPKDFQEKFLPRELEIWPKVKHPNVITMYQYILHESKIYMILEYAMGGDMLAYIQKLNGSVPEKDCKLWIKQICSALQYLHQNNIIHRDLKLENLLIDSRRNIKLCDFGFSKDLKTNGNDDLSRTYCGSKAYASPGNLYIKVELRNNDFLALNR
jgi:serine kinase